MQVNFQLLIPKYLQALQSILIEKNSQIKTFLQPHKFEFDLYLNFPDKLILVLSPICVSKRERKKIQSALRTDEKVIAKKILISQKNDFLWPYHS